MILIDPQTYLRQIPDDISESGWVVEPVGQSYLLAQNWHMPPHVLDGQAHASTCAPFCKCG
jgi:hypothetical protein